MYLFITFSNFNGFVQKQKYQYRNPIYVSAI